MNDMTPRIAYIDSTRAILIAMVVLGHILNGANPGYDIIPYTLAQEFMGSFHMPAFFILSGTLLNAKNGIIPALENISCTARTPCLCRISSLKHLLFCTSTLCLGWCQ